MPERGSSWLDRLRGLLGHHGEEAPRFRGREVELSGRQALIDLEGRMGQRLCRVPDGAISAAAGLALTGMRVTALVPADELARAVPALRAATARRAPFVIHAAVADGGHAGLHAVAECGCLTLIARDAQHALDLALAARFVAERALVPAVIALDGAEILDPVVELLLPDDDLLESFLKGPADEIECPTPSQRLLFGERRRNVPRWFDPDRPAAVGLEPAAEEYDAAVAGRRLFFTDHLPEIADPAFELLGQLTGRPLAPLTYSGIERARQVIVTQGSAIANAERVAAGHSREGIGVVGLVRNRPFPEAALREALQGVETVTVLERVDDSETDLPPLLRDLRAALTGSSCRLLSATFDRLDDEHLEAVIANMQRGEAARARVRLGLGTRPRHSEYPKRQVLLDSIARDYPALEQRTLPALAAPAAPPPRRHVPAALPRVVKRFDQIASTYDSVSRFWGEFSEPRAEGEESAPDPYLALGVLPSCTATFHDRASERESVPQIDPDRCTGCGKCWTACPDSSLVALALGTEALLDTTHDAAVGDLSAEPAVAQLRRAHKQLAARLDGALAKSESTHLGQAELTAGFAWLVDKLDLSEADRAVAEHVFERSTAVIEELGPSSTRRLFHEAHREQKGAGNLLMLGVDSRSCQGCGICAAVCADDAIEICPQTEEVLARMRRGWQAWEQLPDTPGKIIKQLSDAKEPGGLAALLLSRHCSLAVTGADGAEPGSGARLATRQIVAVVEFEMQQRLLRQAAELEKLAGKLREAIATSLAHKLPDDNQELLDRLDEWTSSTPVDRQRVQELAEAARGLEHVRWRLTEGRQHLGRARYGLAVVGRDTAEWAIPFPRNPFCVPVVVDTTGEGPELAFGVAEGMLAEMVEDFREIRRARSVLEQNADSTEPERLSRKDLTEEELALCPPLLILTDPVTLTSSHMAGLARLLSSDLPVKVVLLDGRDLLATGADPALLALAHREAFVLSTSVAHPEHLLPGLRAALDFTGAALIHVHTPLPRTHGFEPTQTIERARMAVESRVHPLLRYDPSAPGVFGRRLSLEGNPSIDRAWVEEPASPRNPATWARGESRYAETAESELERLVGKRGDHWAVLQELAGVVTPFTETVREAVEQQARGEQTVAIESLSRKHEAELAEVQERQRSEQAARLRDRLMQLAGYDEGSSS